MQPREQVAGNLLSYEGIPVIFPSPLFNQYLFLVLFRYGVGLFLCYPVAKKLGGANGQHIPYQEKGYIPVGFNAWREPDSKLAIGEKHDMDVFRPEGSDKYYWGIDAPPEYWACKDKQKRAEMLTRNMQGILQFFHIKVFVFPDHVQIKGAIQPQILEIMTRKKTKTASIIGSPSQTGLIVTGYEQSV